MKRVLSFLFLLVAFPAYSADYLTEDEQAYLDKKSLFKFGVLKEAWLPYWGGDAPPFSGINHDYAVGISNELGFKFTYTFYNTLNDLHNAIEDGEIDAIVGLGKTDAREKQFLLSDVIYESQRIIWLRDKRLMDKPRNSLRWVCVKGSSYCDAIANRGYSSLSLVNTPDAAQEMIQQDLADATILNYTSLLSSLGKNISAPGKVVFDREIGAQDYRIIVAKHKPMLLSIFNKVIAAEKAGETKLPINSHNIYSLAEQANFNFVMGGRGGDNVVRYTVEEDVFPLSYRDEVDGSLKGYVHDLMKVLDSRTILELEYVPMYGQDPMQMLRDGKVDILPYQHMLDVDKQDFLITEKYSTLEFLHLRMKNTSDKKRLGILDRMGDFYNFVRTDGRFDSIQVYTRFDNLLTDLKHGQITDMLINKDLVNQTLMLHFDTDYEVIEPSKESRLKMDIGMVMREENVIMHDLINKVISTLGPEELDRIRALHSRITVNYGFDKNEIITMSSITFLVFLLILMPLVVSYRKVKKAKREALQAIALRNQFLAVVSHELRNPLAAMLGLMEILSKKITNDDSQLLLKNAINSADSLKHHVNNILDFSKIEANQLRLDVRRCSLIDELSPMLRSFEANTAVKALTFDVNWAPTPYIYAQVDAMRLNQVVMNLLSNAVKFTEQGKISVNITTTKTDLSIEINDTGCGMTEEQLSRIYSPFVQADASIARRYGGTGLGMSIVQSLLRLMKGSIEISSELGKGTTVSVSLPIKAEAVVVDHAGHTFYTNHDQITAWLLGWGINLASQSDADHWLTQDEYGTNIFPDLLLGQVLRLIDHGTEPVSPVNSQRLTGHVLVADDDPINRLLIKRQLKEIGVTATLVDDGQQALDELERHGDEYALLITDCHMPNMDGYELTKQAKRHCWKGRVVIGCTAEDSRIAVTKAELAGMDTVIFKPYTLMALYKVLKPHLQATEPAPIMPTIWIDDYLDSEREEVATVVVSAMTADIVQLNQSPEEYKAIAHRIKGSAGVLGLRDLSLYASQLELSENAAEIAHHKHKLVNEMSKVIAQAEHWLQVNKPE
ncbi:ATP-binding protein [Photobacterium japonica]|uniref:ATP-binding protein n=1 Tax=Photobacterium japonica TaxID=2910235 RepID=UPI003D138493